MTKLFEKDVFLRQLIETISWCSTRNISDSGKYSLRQLNPLIPAIEGRCLPFDDKNLSLMVDSLIDLRKLKLIEMTILLKEEPLDLGQGRLMGLRPNSVFAMDGVMELESNGFFDYCDFPAWDTWVYHVHGPDLVNQKADDHRAHYLISWIPAPLIPSIEIALETSADGESTQWLPELNIFDMDAWFLEVLNRWSRFADMQTAL